VFYVNLPIGLLSLAILVAELPQRPGARRRFDMTGFALLGLALAAFQLMLDRGNHLDWFDSGEIWLYAFVALSGGWMVVIHFATAKNPLFATSLFADRNFAIGLMFMIVVGVVLFANMALMPPLLQHLFGYDVIDTGLVLMPRGIGVLISMQISGLLIRRGVDPRMIVAAGFAIAAFSQWQMAQWSLAADTWQFASDGLVQGLGLGLIFIPVNVTSFSTLPPQLRTDGSSLLNLARSLGASVGISITTILLAANIQRGHEEIGARADPGSLASIDLATIDRYQSAADVALRMLDNEVNRQAAMVAYVDDFWLMMWLALAAVPLALFMRPAAPPAGH
jgi:MFS transporter, DHA2 family, multidrug resistance protein